MAAFAMTKEKLVQDILNKGDRGKHLNCLIKIMERKKITIFREIVCWLLHILEEHQRVKFTPEDLQYLHQEIIEGHEELGSKKPIENSNNEDVIWNIEKKGHGGIQSAQPQEDHNILLTVANEAELIRRKLLETIPSQEIWEETKSPLKLTTGSMLGEGGFGKVFQVTAQVAMKFPKERGRSDFINEVRFLSYLKHPNIVASLGTYSGALLMEMMDENLHHHIQRKGGSLSIDSIMGFGLDVAKGLEYLQQIGIIHLDVKSRNILINNNPEVAKLCDFGLAKVLTQLNVSPEVLHYDGQLFGMDPFYPESFKTDIWNFGWVLFEMAVCRPPDFVKLSHLVKQSNGSFPDLDELGTNYTRGVVPGGRLKTFLKYPDLNELVTKCIGIVPGSRPEISQVISILKEYFKMSP